MNPLAQYEIPGRVAAFIGKGGLPGLKVETGEASAEVYQHGAHVVSYRKAGEEPLLFLSGQSRFDARKAIRGGVPIVFPWFGPREGLPRHGYARTTAWEVEAVEEDGGVVELVFSLPKLGGFDVRYRVRVGGTLRLELEVANSSIDEDHWFEACLHTYFHTGPVEDVVIKGLEASGYFDKVAGQIFARTRRPVRIEGEIDRIYQKSGGELAIEDPGLGRRILIRTSGAKSTVVWNPWEEKSRAMEDFGDGEYRRMLCVESGNVGEEGLCLMPGKGATLAVEYLTERW